MERENAKKRGDEMKGDERGPSMHAPTHAKGVRVRRGMYMHERGPPA